MRFAVLGENLEDLQQQGVRVRSDRGDFEAHPPATDDSNEIGPVDFVFLGLKANSYAGCGPLAGKPLELAAIVNSVVELADLTGVPAPSLRAVSAASGLLAETVALG